MVRELERAVMYACDDAVYFVSVCSVSKKTEAFYLSPSATVMALCPKKQGREEKEWAGVGLVAAIVLTRILRLRLQKPDPLSSNLSSAS